MKNILSPLSSVLEDLFKGEKSPLSKTYFLFQLSQSWKQLVGEELAKHAFPLDFKNQELILALTDSSSMQEIQFAKELLRKKINKQFPSVKVNKISLRVKKEVVLKQRDSLF